MRDGITLYDPWCGVSCQLKMGSHSLAGWLPLSWILDRRWELCLSVVWCSNKRNPSSGKSVPQQIVTTESCRALPEWVTNAHNVYWLCLQHLGSKLDCQSQSSSQTGPNPCWNSIHSGPLWGYSTGHQWIPLKGVSNLELWSVLFCYLWDVAVQTIEFTVIWTAMALMWHHCNVKRPITSLVYCH